MIQVFVPELLCVSVEHSGSKVFTESRKYRFLLGFLLKSMYCSYILVLDHALTILEHLLQSDNGIGFNPKEIDSNPKKIPLF